MQLQTRWIRALAASMGFAAACYVAACSSADPQSDDEGPVGEAQQPSCTSGVVCNGTCCAQPPNTNPPSCFANLCIPGSCKSGFASCDGTLANGCETSLSSPHSCGSCTNDCTAAPHVATTACFAFSGTCEVLSCASGFQDCDGSAGNGCEVNLNTDPSNCGSCGHVCPSGARGTATCTNGTCGIQCNAGFGDCNVDGGQVGGDGCETTVNTDARCGSCDTHCGATNMVSTVCQSDGMGSFSCQNLPCPSGTCPGSLACVSGSCVDTAWDPCHCGSANSLGTCAANNALCCTNGTQAHTGAISGAGTCADQWGAGYFSIGSCCGHVGQADCPDQNFGTCF